MDGNRGVLAEIAPKDESLVDELLAERRREPSARTTNRCPRRFSTQPPCLHT
jgi:hypothetical protein